MAEQEHSLEETKTIAVPADALNAFLEISRVFIEHFDDGYRPPVIDRKYLAAKLARRRLIQALPGRQSPTLDEKGEIRWTDVLPTTSAREKPQED